MTTSPSNIQPEAIEAALAAIFPKGPISEFSRTTWTRTVNEILEAAAPHIEKGAYERGWGAGFRHTLAAMKS